MTISELYALGAYVVAGNVDIYRGGRHVRLGVLTAGGDLVLTADGEEFAQEHARPAEPVVDVVPAPWVEPAAPAPAPRRKAARKTINSDILNAEDE